MPVAGVATGTWVAAVVVVAAAAVVASAVPAAESAFGPVDFGRPAAGVGGVGSASGFAALEEQVPADEGSAGH